jgi:DNA-binding LytR/AlgR family response regulator
MSDTLPETCEDAALLWEHIHFLRSRMAGPEGYDSWKDAALDERLKRAALESRLEAAEANTQRAIDAALIDINLGQSLSFDFARVLRDHAIPFVFLTGYDASIVPGDLVGAPCISKPAEAKRIVEELSRIAFAQRITGDPG